METIINIIGWLLFGLVIGAIARFLMPGKDAMSWPATIVLGIIGSLVGGFIGHLLAGSGDGYVRFAGWIMSVIGAIIVLFVYNRMAVAKTGGAK